ncbi:hypothetical protein [Actinokineospora diospyrosa]|uniref:Sensory transduction regulator n=1 Tax=Actinokineospora diospyrosa TaxID=103728 RepID=A0ABT1IJA8_9PSEU|nr:hypothetical protein [Actinokineospora diospyrosa]MCP2272644.1 hypothetical protein [Actinokineospora diospyrosa]
MSMTDLAAVRAVVRDAWTSILAPPLDDLRLLAWSCGEDAWRAPAGVPPVEVDIFSPGFLGGTPLLDLPPRAAADYLGSYALSLLEGLEYQQKQVVFYDILTRAHLITCLNEPRFWDEVIRAHLPAGARAALVPFCASLAEHREALALSEERSNNIVGTSLQ